jgi:osmotically-inducible protein OsmY
MMPSETDAIVNPVVPGLISVLEAHVKHQLGGRVSHFQVLFDGKSLVLRGQTRSQYARQLAQQAVMEITDLTIVANEMRA